MRTLEHPAPGIAPRYLQVGSAVYRLQRYLGVDAIAEIMNVTPQFLNARKWLLPNWGESEGAGTRHWSLASINSWLEEMTPAQRQAAWDALSPSVKKARAIKWGRH